VHSRIACQLRVERRREKIPAARCDDMPVVVRDRVDIRADTLDPWRPDEHTAIRPPRQTVHVQVSLERVHLTAIGVTADGDVHESERLLVGKRVEHLGGHEDGPRTGAPHGHASVVLLADRIVEVVRSHELPDGGRLAARDHEAREIPELFRQPHRDA
jgi:hypothetical protein